MNPPRWAALLAASMVAACAEHPPAPVPPMQPDAPRPTRVTAYTLGSWTLGEPLSTLALSKPDLWSRHRVEGDQRDQLVMILPLADAPPAAGGAIAFMSPPRDGDQSHTVPSRVIALGERSLAQFSPALPPLTFDDIALGPITFLVENPIDARDTDIDRTVQTPVAESSPQQRAAVEQPRTLDRPYLLRVEMHDTRVARVMVDGKPIGYVLGDVPSNANDPFHRHLRRLVRRHIGLS